MTAPAKPDPPARRIPCSTCGVGAGSPCGKVPLGVPWGWVTVRYHAARVRAAEAAAKEKKP